MFYRNIDKLKLRKAFETLNWQKSEKFSEYVHNKIILRNKVYNWQNNFEKKWAKPISISEIPIGIEYVLMVGEEPKQTKRVVMRITIVSNGRASFFIKNNVKFREYF